MSITISYRYLIDPDQACIALRAFAHQTIIGVDTETYWDFTTRQNHLSLLQLASPTGEVVVIDALASGMEEARPLIENPQVWMAAHNARFDDGVLRHAGFAPAGFVDTLRLARRTLRLRSFGLASVADHLFGVTLDKSHQRDDWRHRPLTREQLDYAALDAQTALRVYLTLTERLEIEGRLTEELRRARLRVVPEDEVRAEAARKLSADLRPLTAEERKIVERLRNWRNRAARRERVPVFLVCADKTLEHLAIKRPHSPEQLQEIFGLGDGKIAKYGAELLMQLTDQSAESLAERTTA